MMSPRWKGSYCEQQVYQSRGNKDSVFMQMPLMIKAGEGRRKPGLDWKMLSIVAVCFFSREVVEGCFANRRPLHWPRVNGGPRNSLIWVSWMSSDLYYPSACWLWTVEMGSAGYNVNFDSLSSCPKLFPVQNLWKLHQEDDEQETVQILLFKWSGRLRFEAHLWYRVSITGNV